MSDFRTVLIEDARIADITPTEVFGVQSSASQSTYQQFQAVSASNSSIVFNVQIPSENIVIDRHVLCASTVSLQITASNVPAGFQVFQYGLTEALQAFPLNSLMTTVQATINNVSVSTNLQDVLPMLMVMSDRKVLSRYNSLTPSLRDAHWGEYKDAPATNANPLASYNNSSYDEAFEPRGSFSLDFLQIDRYQGGVFQDNSPVSLANTNVFKIFLTVSLTEPFLALSPFVNCEPEMSAGLVGVNNMSMVLNIDSSCRRVLSTANNAVVGGNSLVGYISSIALGWAVARRPSRLTRSGGSIIARHVGTGTARPGVAGLRGGDAQDPSHRVVTDRLGDLGGLGVACRLDPMPVGKQRVHCGQLDIRRGGSAAMLLGGGFQQARRREVMLGHRHERCLVVTKVHRLASCVAPRPSMAGAR